MRRLALLPALPALSLFACFRAGGSEGRWQGVAKEKYRAPSSENISPPAGYRIDSVVNNLAFPVGVTFDDAGEIYVVGSGYSYGASATGE